MLNFRLAPKMSDRVTQIQDLLDGMANLICNSIGCLQASAPPCDFNAPSKEHVEEPNCELFASEVTRMAKEIEMIVDSLPYDENSIEEHEKKLLELDEDRAREAKELEKRVERAEELLDEVNALLSEIAAIQMNSRPLV